MDRFLTAEIHGELRSWCTLGNSVSQGAPPRKEPQPQRAKMRTTNSVQIWAAHLKDGCRTVFLNPYGSVCLRHGSINVRAIGVGTGGVFCSHFLGSTDLLSQQRVYNEVKYEAALEQFQAVQNDKQKRPEVWSSFCSNEILLLEQLMALTKSHYEL